MSQTHISPPPMTRVRVNFIITALALGAFAIGVGEFSTMGLMLDMSRGLGVTESQVGTSISTYALGVVVGAPLLAFIGARFERKSLLLSLALTYALAHFASAIAPTYETLLAARFVSGLPHGAYFGIATLVAASVSPPEKKGVAVSKVMLGLSVSILIGNPLAVWLGQQLSWRVAFGVVGVLAVLTVLMVSWTVPPTQNEKTVSAAQELKAFNRSQVWLTLFTATIGFSGMLGVFAYLAPTVVNVTKASESWMPWLTVAFGIGSILGMIVGGRLVDLMRFKAIGLMFVWSIAVLAMFPTAATSLWGLGIATVAVGTMMALPVAFQTHLMDIAGDAQTLAAASNQAALNAANALGPWLGGLAINAGMGFTSPSYIGALTSMAGLLAWIATLLMMRTRQSRRHDDATILKS